MSSKQNETSQGIQVSKEFGVQIQRLAMKFQSFDLTYVELKEQVENLTKTLLAKMSTLETEKIELQRKLEKSIADEKEQKGN
jgi:hypothetical protein